MLLLGEQHAAVDDQQLAVELEDGHVAADLAQSPERNDAHGVRRQRWRGGQFRVHVAHAVSPASLSAVRMTSTCSAVAGVSGRRTRSLGMRPRARRPTLEAVMGRPSATRPPVGTTRVAFGASGGGVASSACMWLML